MIITKEITAVKLKLIDRNILPHNFIGPDGEEYTWIWLPSAVTKSLLNLRNAEHVLEHMRNKTPISEQTHMSFLKNYNTIKRIDFVLMHKQSREYVGGVNISLTSYGYEMGKYIGNNKFLSRGLAFLMVTKFIHYIKNNIEEIREIKAVTSIMNFKNINLNFKLGFKIIGLVDDEYWLMELK